jgi:hypothetical protein
LLGREGRVVAGRSPSRHVELVADSAEADVQDEAEEEDGKGRDEEDVEVDDDDGVAAQAEEGGDEGEGEEQDPLEQVADPAGLCGAGKGSWRISLSRGRGCCLGELPVGCPP